MAEMYFKNYGVPVFKEKSNLGDSIAKLDFSEKVQVIGTDNRWVNVKTGKGVVGWVYLGNLGSTPPPADNKNELSVSGGKASTSLAGKGLSANSIEYGNRHSVGDAIEQVQWLEKYCNDYSDDKVTEYMKSKKLGVYSGGAS